MNNLSLQIKTLTPEYADVVADLHLQIWHQAYVPIFGAARLQQLSAQEFRQIWQKRLLEAKYECMGIFRQEQLIGFCGWGQYSSVTAEIYHFYLHADFWGLGIAEQIMEHLLKTIDTAGYAQVVLWVLKENRRAQRFYARWGFTPTGRAQERYRYTLKLEEIQLIKSSADL